MSKFQKKNTDMVAQNPKLRRCNSTTEAMDRMRAEEQFLQEMEITKRVHQSGESPFSTNSGFSNFRGFLNLGLILLIVSNARVALENILKYGILVDPVKWVAVFLSDPYHWPSLSLTLMIPVYVSLIYGIERLNAKSRISEDVSFVLTLIVLAAILIVPSSIIVFRHPNPIFSGAALTLHVVYFLKLWSYSQANRWYRENTSKLRHGRRRSLSSFVQDGDETQNHSHLARYPQNINLNDFVYYLIIPTLCYELHFPRNLRIRKRFLFKRFLEMIFLPQVMMGLIQQWILPLLHNSLEPFSNANWSRTLERLLKLAIPNHLIWLTFFYVYFHSMLNVAAEVMLFADRTFYKDWWNCTSVTEFWSNWNIPVHRFCLRHIYKPLLRRRLSKFQASIIVFLFSAFLHELIVSVPLRMFRVWAFMGMSAQVPFAAFVSKYLKNYPQVGNVCVWVSLILGQPLVLLMYFHDYYIQNILNT